MPWTVTVPASVIVLILVLALYAVIANSVKRGRTEQEFARLDHYAIADRWLDTIGPLDGYELTVLLKSTLITISRNGGATYEDMLTNVAVARRFVREHPPEERSGAADDILDSGTTVPEGITAAEEVNAGPSSPHS